MPGQRVSGIGGASHAAPSDAAEPQVPSAESTQHATGVGRPGTAAPIVNPARSVVSGLGRGVHMALPHATGGAGAPAALPLLPPLPLLPRPAPAPDEPATGCLSPESSPQLRAAEHNTTATYELSKARRGRNWCFDEGGRAWFIARLVLRADPNGSANGLDCAAIVSARMCAMRRRARLIRALRRYFTVTLLARLRGMSGS
jgi:hypothetical protein